MLWAPRLIHFVFPGIDLILIVTWIAQYFYGNSLMMCYGWLLPLISTNCVLHIELFVSFAWRKASSHYIPGMSLFGFINTVFMYVCFNRICAERFCETIKKLRWEECRRRGRGRLVGVGSTVVAIELESEGKHAGYEVMRQQWLR